MHLEIMRWMRALMLLWVTVSVAAAQFELPGARTFGGQRKHTKARLVLSHDSAQPGETIFAAVELTMDPGWHTYWQSPGDSGQATEIHWGSSRQFAPGEIQWPVPERFTTPDELKLTTFVYHQRAVLLVPIQIAREAAAGTNELTALVKWLECEVACIPGSNTVRASLVIGPESKPSADTNFFAEAQQRLPSKQIPGTVTAQWDQPGNVTNRAFVISWNASAVEPDFFPFTNALATVSAKTAVLASSGSNAVLRSAAQRFDAKWPEQVSGILVRKEGEALTGYEVALTLRESATDVASNASSIGTKSLGMWLFYAFIGGLILNIMPCVLPVIALKILGFVNQSREHPRRVRTLGLLYTLGVIVSFLVLAGIVIAVKAAGQKAGWGMQFSNPQFIVILTTVVTLVTLNLFGVFEITLGGGAMGAASNAASRHGGAGAFMNGVLATVLATPCTAPFLGASLGFAFAQPAHLIILFFIVIALGLALPYLLLSWNPSWLKFLPKPGAWMERFKVAMGFPLLATAVWLFTLTITHYGKRVWWLGVFLVVLSLAAWIYGEFVQRGRSRRGVALAVVLFLLAGGIGYAVESKLRWRQPILDEAGGGTLQEAPGGIAWQRWSPEAVAKFRAEGRPILVDFTADWCVTCNTIVKPALESEIVRAKLKELNAVSLLADYTRFPPAISAELERFQRAGVPMVLVYPKDASKPPMVLPEALTANMVVKALEEAGK